MELRDVSDHLLMRSIGFKVPFEQVRGYLSDLSLVGLVLFHPDLALNVGLRHQLADRLAIDDIPFVPHRHRQAAVAVPPLVLMVQFRDALPLDGPFVGLRSVIVVECGSGHPLDFQQDVKLVFWP